MDWNGFSGGSNCRSDAVGMAPTASWCGPWSTPGGSCDYGRAVLSHVTRVPSAGDDKPGFPMADWAWKPRAQIDGRAVRGLSRGRPRPTRSVPGAVRHHLLENGQRLLRPRVVLDRAEQVRALVG